MEIFYSTLDLALDLLLLLPPTDAVAAWNLPADAPLYVAFGGIAVFAMSLVGGGAQTDAFGFSPTAWFLIVGLIFGIAFISQPWEFWKSLLVVGYVPLVLAVRGGEGAVFASALARRSLWFVPAAIAVCVAIAAYCVISDLPPRVVANIRLGWVVFTAAVAAARVAWKVSTSIVDSEVNAFLIWAGTFVLFMSTTIYVATSDSYGVVFRYIFIVGVLIGLFASRSRGPGDIEAGDPASADELAPGEPTPPE